MPDRASAIRHPLFSRGLLSGHFPSLIGNFFAFLNVSFMIFGGVLDDSIHRENQNISSGVRYPRLLTTERGESSHAYKDCTISDPRFEFAANCLWLSCRSHGSLVRNAWQQSGDADPGEIGHTWRERFAVSTDTTHQHADVWPGHGPNVSTALST